MVPKSYDLNNDILYLDKYLSSHIKGKLVRNTCMAPFIKWVKKTLKAYGGLTIIISIKFKEFSLSLVGNLTSDYKSQRTIQEFDEQ